MHRKARKLMFTLLIQLCELITSFARCLKGYAEVILGTSKNRIYFESSGLSIVFDGNQDGKAVLGEPLVVCGVNANSITEVCDQEDDFAIGRIYGRRQGLLH